MFKRFKSLWASIKANFWLKAILLIESISFTVSIYIMHRHGACLENAIEKGDVCIRYAPFLEILGFDYIYLVLNILLTVIVVFTITIKLFFWTKKHIYTSTPYHKILALELWLIFLASFAGINLFMMVYDGTSCMVGNCVTTSLLTYMAFWGAFLAFISLFNPLTFAFLLLPYIVVLLFQFSKEKH